MDKNFILSALANLTPEDRIEITLIDGEEGFKTLAALANPRGSDFWFTKPGTEFYFVKSLAIRARLAEVVASKNWGRFDTRMFELYPVSAESFKSGSEKLDQIATYLSSGTLGLAVTVPS